MTGDAALPRRIETQPALELGGRFARANLLASVASNRDRAGGPKVEVVRVAITRKIVHRYIARRRRRRSPGGYAEGGSAHKCTSAGVRGRRSGDFHRHAQGRRGLSGMTNCFAIAVSLGCNGVPSRNCVDVPLHRFEPNGIVQEPLHQMSTSIITTSPRTGDHLPRSAGPLCDAGGSRA